MEQAILIDNNTLTGFKNYIEHRSADYFFLSSFAQFIEGIVLSDRVVVDDMSFRISKLPEFFAFLNDELPQIISGLEISDEDRSDALKFANMIQAKTPCTYENEYDEIQQLRAYFYFYMSEKHDLPYFPHDRRAFFLSLMEGMVSTAEAEFKKVFNIYYKLKHSAYQELREKGYISYKYKSLEFPQVFYYAVARANNLLELIDIVLDLRESRNARAFRKWCTEFREAEVNGDEITASKMFNEVEHYLKKICTYQQTNYSAELQFSFTPSITFADIPVVFKRKKHLLFLKQVLSVTNYADLENKLEDILRI